MQMWDAFITEISPVGDDSLANIPGMLEAFLVKNKDYFQAGLLFMKFATTYPKPFYDFALATSRLREKFGQNWEQSLQYHSKKCEAFRRISIPFAPTDGLIVKDLNGLLENDYKLVVNKNFEVVKKLSSLVAARDLFQQKYRPWAKWFWINQLKTCLQYGKIVKTVEDELANKRAKPLWPFGEAYVLYKARYSKLRVAYDDLVCCDANIHGDIEKNGNVAATFACWSGAIRDEFVSKLEVLKGVCSEIGLGESGGRNGSR